MPIAIPRRGGPWRRRAAVALGTFGLGLAVVGCGAGPGIAPAASAPTPSTAAAAAKPAGVSSNQEAGQELAATRELYTQAQRALEQGDRARALELLNTAYLEHFERVEPWLDQRLSTAYRQQVEAAVSRDLRGKLRAGTATDAELLAQFPVALQMLAEAQARLAALP